MSNVAIDLTKTVKEIITTMKTAIDNLNTDVSSNKTAIDSLNTDVSSNKTAIDSLKGQVLQAVYPVGSVYVSITDSRNPADILGFGTWEALPAGHSLVAVGTATETHGDTTKTFTFEAGKTYGEFEHQLTVGELPNVKGTFGMHERNGVYARRVSGVFSYSGKSGSWAPSIDSDGGIITMNFGKDEYHNNIAPCTAAYTWKRTA